MCSGWPRLTLARPGGRWRRCCPRTAKKRPSHEPHNEKNGASFRGAGRALAGFIRLGADAEVAVSRKNRSEERPHGVAAGKTRRANDQPVRDCEDGRRGGPGGTRGTGFG